MAREKRNTKRTVLSLHAVNDWKLRWLAKQEYTGVTSYLATLAYQRFNEQADSDAWEELFIAFPHIRTLYENWGDE